MKPRKGLNITILKCGSKKHKGLKGKVFSVYPFGQLGVVLENGGWCYTTKSFILNKSIINL